MADSSKSDHIGRVGERHFDLLADKAKLLNAQLLPDRIGRDRIIEFEVDETTNLPFDKRPPALGCSVQIKSVEGKQNSVRLSLSVAERLASDPKPAFICIIRIDEKDELKDIYLVHILGANLEKVLKRLRLEYSKGTKHLNKRTISFSISTAAKLEPTPDGLKRGLSEMIGLNLDEYAKVKAEQRRTLGFEDIGQLSGTLTFDSHSDEEVIDGFLGLQKLKLAGLEMFEERFAIKLPFDIPRLKELETATLEVTPSSALQAKLHFSNTACTTKATINCDLISPGIPNLPKEKLKFVARTRLFDLVIGQGKVKAHPKESELQKAELLLEEWANYYRAWKLIAQGDCDVDCVVNGATSLFSAHLHQSRGDVSRINPTLQVIEAFQAIKEEAGADDKPVGLQSIVDCQKEISLVYAYFFEPSSVGKLQFEFVGDLPFEQRDNVPVLFISGLVVGEEYFAYGLRFEMSIESNGDRHQFSSQRMQPLLIEALPESAPSTSNLERKLRKISGIEFSLVQDFFSNAN